MRVCNYIVGFDMIMLEGFDIKQLISYAYYRSHLDVLMTCSDSQLLHYITSVDFFLSDHVAILLEFEIPCKPH